jgi:hypothetical protein
VKKTKAWNSGQLTGLERCQADLEDDLEASILTSYEIIISLKSIWEEDFFSERKKNRRGIVGEYSLYYSF